MILSIIGILLGLVAIGLFFWLKNDQKMSNDLHEAELQHTHQGMKALMDDFNNYQITNERKIAKLEKDMEIRFKSRDRRMDNMNKSLPSIIGQVVGQIEFSQDILNRKM